VKIVEEPTAFAAVSELRTRMDQILNQLRRTPVVLEKHGRPVAILVEPSRHKALVAAVDAAMDILRAFEQSRGKGKKFSELEKRLRAIEKGSSTS
jgi:PHD/YefM family antitoxin component YafN of YafNO toxin-antitoxin module